LRARWIVALEHWSLEQAGSSFEQGLRSCNQREGAW
jgi:hypothetical protein